MIGHDFIKDTSLDIPMPVFRTRRWEGPASESIGGLEDLREVLLSDLNPKKRIRSRTGRFLDEYEYVVACDSQVHRRQTTFVVGVVVRQYGHGGWGYYWKYHTKPLAPTFDGTWLRLWHEVVLTASIATEIADIEGLVGVDLYTELDFNGEQPTISNKVLKVAEGYLKGFGFRTRVKPNAWCATFYAGRESCH